MQVRKGRGGGVLSNEYFSRATLLPRRPTTGSRTTTGWPAETINTKVSGKVNLIFYKLNLFQIFLVGKVKKKKKKKQKKDHEEFFYYHSGRCHAMWIQHQYANLTRILQLWMGYSRKNPHPNDGRHGFLTPPSTWISKTAWAPLPSGFPGSKTPSPIWIL